MDYKDKTKEELLHELLDLQQEYLSLKKLHENGIAKNNTIQIECLYKAIEQSPILTFIINTKGVIKFVNSNIFELTGYTKEELIGKNLSVLSAGDTTNEQYHKVFETLKKTGAWKGEFIHKKKNGELYQSFNSINEIINNQGEIENYIVFEDSITKNKIKEEKFLDINKNLKKKVSEKTSQLAESNEFTKKIANSVPGMIYQFKLFPNGTICFPYSSNGIKDIYRLNPEDVIADASSLFSIVHPDDYKEVIKTIHQSGETLTLWQHKYRVKFSDGSVHWLQGNAMPERETDGSIIWHGFISDITDAKKIEDDLLWNQTLLNLMASSSPLGFLVVDNRDDKILYFNNRFCEIWGIEHLATKMKNGELKNNDIVPECLPVLMDIPAFAESCKPLQDESNRIVITDEIPFINNRMIQRFSTQIRGENDEYFGRFYIFEDITAQKKLVNDLAEERTRLNEIIKGTNAGTWEWNVQTGETKISERWAEIIGYTIAELAPINVEIWGKFVHPDDSIVSNKLLEKHFKGELEHFTLEVRMKHKNGHWVWVLETGKVHSWTKDEKPLMMSGFHLDISENKRIIEDLKESQVTHRALNEAAFDAIFFSEKGICIEQNEAARQIFGYTDEEAIGKPGTDWIIEADRELVMQNMLSGFQEPYEVTALKKDGSTFPCMLSGKMMNFKGRSVRVTSLRDITIQKQAEAETNKARKEAEAANLAKSEFLSRMSHELRTPLNSIMGFAQLMEMGELNFKQKNGVGHILNSSKHLLGLINEVLELSKIEAGFVKKDYENVDILQVIFLVIDALKPVVLEKKIKVDVAHPIAVPSIIKSDKKLITQVLFNLLNNAVKYNKTEGTIKIGTKLIASNTNEADKIKISITDTGKGILPENLHKLFNPFERIDAENSGIEGSGLGLSVVKKLIGILEGNVGVESEAGVGSTFWIELPLQSNEDLQHETIETQNEEIKALQIDIGILEKDKDNRADELNVLKNDNSVKDLNSKKGIILCIEDNKKNIELIKQVIDLKRPNIEIINSLTGKETVQLAKFHQPDLILLDLNLTDMSGNEILKNLQANNETKHIPIIVMSANVSPQQIEKALNLGAKKYLTKPLSLAAFIETIDEWIFTKNN